MGSCGTSSECAYGTNMVCLLSTCTCSNPNLVYWNGTYCGKNKKAMNIQVSYKLA